MRKIYSGKSQIVGGGTTKTLHTGPGKIYTIIVTNENTTADAITLYDDTSVVAGNILFKATLALTGPIVIHLPQNTPIIFENGLTVVTGALVRAFLITEAEV